jgi:DNA polymerase V
MNRGVIIRIQKAGPALSHSFSLFITSVPAGFPSPAADYHEDGIDLNALLVKTPSATFFVKVEGDSMLEAFIPHKATLVVDRSLSPASGDIIVAVVNGEFTVKRLVKDHTGIFLSPANPKYKKIRITEEMGFQVWGVVSKIIIDPKET